ncbi:MAG: NAD(P)(+) transhydrogenase (Re/Si-specific) subunit beta [Candidatus Marinimicrobia bacterium]|nr:NAD(P)(+) transhydrogenase (Re/Si-specific) subunit beta [Candidatus Neomarinimicrobiota bacterium]
MSQAVVNLVYLIAAVLFIFALTGLSHPRTAVRGNLLGAFGMLIAIVVTLLDKRIVSFEVIVAGLAVGAIIGALMAYRSPMTAIPQVVAVFNGLGGGASALAAGAALEEALRGNLLEALATQTTVAAGASALIGGVAFTGSMIAFAKLRGLITEKPVLLPGRHILNIVLFLACLGLGAWLVIDASSSLSFWILVGVASLLGIMLVMPIGGADMPVVIALLNSYSGIAAASVGWVLNNNVLIIAGCLVGAAGFILTALMSKAMNRSLPNIIFAGVGAAVATESESEDVYAGKVKSTSPDEVAMMLESARRVVIAPGYGMAVAHAQYAIRDLMILLNAKGVEVDFAVHPVAGRMPGHMNVLLAEAHIPYDNLKDMDEINPTFGQTDVVLVIGANDVVNPLARESDTSIPIAGMPILNVDEARAVVIIKRSLSPGFAGIANPLFAADNALMLYGDAKQIVTELTAALKEV